MRPRRLRNLDLNLLVVFDTIMLERSVARASERLSLSESAVSHALTRLRKTLGDPLFTREGARLRPSTRARQLAVPVRRALQRIESAINFAPFDPSQQARTFVLAAEDYTCALILPGLLAGLRREAPLCDVAVAPIGRSDMVRQLDDGLLDFAIGCFISVPERFRRLKLFDETYVLLVRSGHPLTRGAVTARRLLGFPQVAVDYAGHFDSLLQGLVSERGVLRQVAFEGANLDLARHARGRGRIALRVPGFFSATRVLLGCDLVASMPRRLASEMIECGGLVALEPPFKSAPVGIDLIWHRRVDADLGLQWFRRRVEAVALRLAGAEQAGRRSPGVRRASRAS